MGTKKGSCFLVPYWRRLNCVGSLKVLNNVTLWAPSLSLLDMRNLQEQVKKAFWPFTVWINCSGDLKNFENSQPSASNFKRFSWSLEQFFLTILVTKYHFFIWPQKLKCQLQFAFGPWILPTWAHWYKAFVTPYCPYRVYCDNSTNGPSIHYVSMFLVFFWPTYLST